MSLSVQPENVIDRMLSQVHSVISGHKDATEKVAYCFFAGGHPLLESVPGLAKTLMFRAFNATIDGAKFRRVQMTPNVLPADIVGTLALNVKTNEFEVRRGPIFCNVFLADEVNRTNPKTQSALLEAMAEQTVTIGDETMRLERLFIVGATQNPIDQEGTYPLPEAQLDRFMLKIRLGYVSKSDEEAMLCNNDLRSENPLQSIKPVVTVEELVRTREEIRTKMYLSPAARDYLLTLVRASRKPGPDTPAEDVKLFQSVVQAGGTKEDEEGWAFNEFIAFGASPRALQCLKATASVRAFHKGRMYVLPEDIQYVFPDVMRHRIILERRALGHRYSTERAIKLLLKAVPVVPGNYKP